MSRIWDQRGATQRRGTGPSDTGVGTHLESSPGMPRWVKATALIVGVLVLAAVVVMFLLGGGHGPGRHGAAAGVFAGIEAPKMPGYGMAQDRGAVGGGQE